MKEKINQLKKEKNAVILTHYYAPAEAQEVADYVGDSFYLAKIAKKSTAEIIDFAKKSSQKEYIICTEDGVDYQLVTDNPDKKFFYPAPHPCCRDMKLNTLEAILSVLEKEDKEVIVEKSVMDGALRPLDRMLELGR